MTVASEKGLEALSSPVVVEGRGLSDWMMKQFMLPHGLLHPVLKAVREDPEQRLDFAIRDHYVNIYYLGTNLMEIRQPNPRVEQVKAWWDKRYLPDYAENRWRPEATTEELDVQAWLEAQDVLGKKDLADLSDVHRHVESFPYRMKAMAACKVRHPKLELKTQQEIVRLSRTDSEGEYLACDTEYSFEHDRHEWDRQYRKERKVSRIDLVVAQRSGRSWDEAAARLVLVELKYKNAAIDGSAGLRSHVRDVGRYLVETGELTRIADDMARVMRQKRELGVVPLAVTEFDLTPPVDYVIAVAKHNSKSQVLRDALLGRYGLDDGPLQVPDGLAVNVALLDEKNPVLRCDELIPLRDILGRPMPPSIFDGKLRPRRLRADERRQ